MKIFHCSVNLLDKLAPLLHRNKMVMVVVVSNDVHILSMSLTQNVQKILFQIEWMNGMHAVVPICHHHCLLCTWLVVIIVLLKLYFHHVKLVFGRFYFNKIYLRINFYLFIDFFIL